MSAGDRERSFARLSGVALQDIRSREEIVISQGFVIPIGPLGVWNAAQAGLGGWTLDRHHFFDPESRILYGGDGTTRTSESSVYGRTISTLLHLPADEDADCLTVDERGNFYVCSGDHILKVTPDGRVTRVAGGQLGGFSGTCSAGAICARRHSVDELAFITPIQKKLLALDDCVGSMRLCSSRDFISRNTQEAVWRVGAVESLAYRIQREGRASS